ncbi:MAG: fibronectin type III domain-containing protein [Pseudomonadales bacterium]
MQPRTSALVSLYAPADVLLDWTAPLQRADTTALEPTEIQGYQICYVGSDGRIVLIPEGREDLISSTSYTIKGLQPDNYQFNVFVIDETNLISAPSDTVSIQIDQFPRR